MQNRSKMTAAPNDRLPQNAPGVVSLLSNPSLQLLVLFAVLLVGIWIGVHVQLRSAYEQLTRGAERDGANLSRAFAEQVRASVRGIDLSLLSLRDAWRNDPAAFHEAVLHQQNYFVREVSFQVAVIDAGGQLVYSSLDPRPQPMSLADREHFSVHRERGTDQLFISKPVLGRVSKRWSIQFTRPVLDQNRRFAGVIVTSVAPDYFSRFYDTLNLGKGSAVTLVRSSGEILARSPNPQLAVGKTLRNRPFLSAGAADAGSFRDTAQTDLIERFYSWRRMPEFGLVVLVGQSVDNLLAPYYHQQRAYFLGGAAASLLLVLFAFGMNAGLRQRARTIAALKASEERNRLRVAALEAVGNAVVVTNTDAEIEWVNGAFEALTGYKREDAFGRRPSELVKSGLQTQEYYDAMWQTILSGKTWRGELVNRRRDGSLYNEELVIAPVTTAAGVITHFVGVKQDISERKRGEMALRQSHDLLAKLSVQVPGVIYQYRLYPDGRSSLPFASQAISEVYEVAPQEAYEDLRVLLARHHPEDAVGVTASILESARTLEPWHHEYRVVLPTRGVRWLLGDARPEKLEDGSILWHGFITDITERKTADEQLRVAAAAFESQEGMMVTDAKGTILRVNRAFEQLTGYSAAEVAGKTPAILKSGRQGEDFYKEMWRIIGQQGHWEGEIWNRKKSGELYPEWLVITAVKDGDGRVTHYVSAFSDITTRKDAEAQIRNLAFYDPLTNLPNRRLLTDRVTQVLAASARSARFAALMLIDLDHFKTLNDTMGHDVGDQLLVQVAQRLCASVRECDTVARLGGDEFVVMLQDLSGEERAAAAQIETVAGKVLAALNQPYPLAGVAAAGYRNTPSIGITQFRGNADAFDVLLKQADIALYQAKDAGRNAIRFYSAEMQAALNEKAVLEAGLRNALADGGFRLHYQPQVDHMRRIVGVEALLRWQPPGRSMVGPGEFVALAEETGLILQIGQWVLETACAQLAAWGKTPETVGLDVSVNVSARQFHQPGFVSMVRAALDASGANPARLKLELTETMILCDINDTAAKMQELRALGVRFALDDFGTGYSSLAYLKRLPLDQVKIDQSFVRDIATDPGDAAIVHTIISMSHSLGLQVIAEGVETSEQLAFLETHRCRLFQGYLFGKPVSTAEIEKMLATDATDVLRAGLSERQGAYNQPS